MILQTAALIISLGVGAYALGKLFNHPGVAMLGAIIVIGTGASVMQGGLVVADGHNTITSERQVAVENIGKSSHLQTVDVSANAPGPTGIAYNDNGSRMYVSSTGSSSVAYYTTADWGLGIATYQASFDVSAQDINPTAVVVDSDGKYIFIAGDETDTLYRYTMSEPYNISTSSLTQSLDVSAESTGPSAVEFVNNGSDMYVISETSAEVNRYTLSDPFNLTTASIVATYDVSAQTTAPTGIAFGADGERMLVSGSSDNIIYQYSLATPYDVGTASYTGYSLATDSQINVLGGVEYESGGEVILVPDTQSDNLVEYDSSSAVSVEELRVVYQDVSTVSGFPVGALVLALGAVMLIRVTGEASKESLKTEDN